MSVVTDVSQPLFEVILPPAAQPQLWRLSVEQYHAMVRHGILTEEHEVELLDGILVAKMTKSIAHSVAILRIPTKGKVQEKHSRICNQNASRAYYLYRGFHRSASGAVQSHNPATG